MSDALSIRVESRNKIVEVNDKGETVTLPFGDQAFIPKMLSLLSEFEKSADEKRARMRELEATPNENKQEAMARITDAAQSNLEFCQQMVTRVNDLLADGDACKKIFGEGTPSMLAFSEFFSQLASLIQQFTTEEQRRNRKYSEKYKKRGVSQ